MAHIGSGGGFSATHSSMAQNATARIGQSRTDAAGERDDVIAHRRVDSIDYDCDRRKDERVLGQRLAAYSANHGFTSANVHLRRRYHFSLD